MRLVPIDPNAELEPGTYQLELLPTNFVSRAFLRALPDWAWRALVERLESSSRGRLVLLSHRYVSSEDVFYLRVMVLEPAKAKSVTQAAIPRDPGRYGHHRGCHRRLAGPHLGHHGAGSWRVQGVAGLGGCVDLGAGRRGRRNLPLGA